MWVRFPSRSPVLSFSEEHHLRTGSEDVLLERRHERFVEVCYFALGNRFSREGETVSTSVSYAEDIEVRFLVPATKNMIELKDIHIDTKNENLPQVFSRT